MQITFGLLTNADGCPVAVEVFEGNTADPAALSSLIAKLRERFALKHIVLVGDRGMITTTRIRTELSPAEGLEWITALRARTRNELLAATERQLQAITAATQRERNPLRGKARIALRVGGVLGRYKMRKHYRLTIEDAGFSFTRDDASIAREAALDGIYVIRTSVAGSALATDEAVAAYKRLARVEHAFRSIKSVDLKVRPIHHRLEERVRAHLLLCMLAYYVEWHMRQALAPMLFEDDDPAAAEAQRRSVVAPAQRSAPAQRKASTKLAADNTPLHSFHTLLSDLATIAKNRILPSIKDPVPFDVITTPTPLQQRAFDLLGVNYRM